MVNHKVKVLKSSKLFSIIEKIFIRNIYININFFLVALNLYSFNNN